MSISYPEALLKRALSYLEAAKTNFEAQRYDVASVEAEIASQLAIKALISLLGYEPSRTHKIRELLSTLTSKLDSENPRQ